MSNSGNGSQREIKVKRDRSFERLYVLKYLEAIALDKIALPEVFSKIA